MLTRHWIAATLANRTTAALWERAFPFSRLSWSQEGEDLILARLLEGTRKGFYVDIGAHDPFRFSNTAYFYARGWSGLNIEPDPDGCTVIRRYRPRDKTLNLGIGAQSANLTYYRFFEPALNTFDAVLAEQRVVRDGYPVRERISVPVRRLDETLAEALPDGQRIDFLSVDTEGFDDQVLASNDWQRFRPRFVVAELLGEDIATLADAGVSVAMREAGYAPVAKALNSVIFKSWRQD